MIEYIENYWSHILSKISRAKKKAPEFGAAIGFDVFIHLNFSHQSQQELASKSSFSSQQKGEAFLIGYM